MEYLFVYRWRNAFIVVLSRNHTAITVLTSQFSQHRHNLGHKRSNLVINLIHSLSSKDDTYFSLPAEAICLLILLSFWSVSDTCIQLLKPTTTLSGVKGWRVALQPNIQYTSKINLILSLR